MNVQDYFWTICSWAFRKHPSLILIVSYVSRGCDSITNVKYLPSFELGRDWIFPLRCWIRALASSSSSLPLQGTDLGHQPSSQTQLSSDRNHYHGEEEEEGFLQGVVLLLRSRIRRREDLGAASESEALQVSRLPQKALNRQRHGHPRAPGPQGIRHQVYPYFPLFFFPALHYYNFFIIA